MSIPLGPEDRHPEGAAGTPAQPDATIEYIAKDGMSPARSERDESQAELPRYEFLDPPRAPGELGWLSHYRVRRLLGEGGMGLVFHAEDSELLRPVALKVIRPELAGKPQAAQRFLREARAMAALKHDNIVTIYQVGQERGVSFLAMEYLRGMSLFHWLERGRKPSPDLVLRIGREIAAGLAAAHKHRLIHRDIKPANIWLEAPAGRVRILDFGLARGESDDVQITNPGIALGTPAYMAPELARGEGVGAASDLFSLGCVLYELCTGQLPFQGTTVMAVLRSLSMDIPIPPREIDAAVPPDLNALVVRLLAKEPADRPPSAQAVVEAIKSIERDLLAARQRIELTVTTPPPGVGPHEPVPADGALAPGAAQLAARARGRGRALWIAAAVLGVSGIVTGALIFAPRAGTTAASRSSPTTVQAASPGATFPEVPAPLHLPDTVAQPKVEGRPAHAAKQLVRGQRAAEEPRVGKPEKVQASRARAQAAELLGKREEMPDGQAAAVPRELAGAKRQETPGKQAAVPRVEVVRPKDWGDVIDPDGDCRIVVDKARNQATIFVPGKPHILSAEIGRVNAPRILRETSGDFDVSVQVTGTGHPGGRATTTQYGPYHGAGILIWQDRENYVRLEIATEERHNKILPYVNFEYRKDGALAVSSGMKNDDGSSYLRLKRRGREINASFGPDGSRWTSFPPLLAKLNDRLNVGLSAINTANKPLDAHFEGFVVAEKTSAGEAASNRASNAR